MDNARGWQGIVLVLASAAAFSTAGFFTRLVSADPWTVLVWRGVFGGLFIALCVVAFEGRRSFAALRAIGWPGLLIAACSTLGTICFINALRRTTVADVTLIYAAAPFVTAAISFLWLREREGRVTLAMSALALAGVVLMLGGAVGAGHLFGDLLALAMTVVIAAMMVLIRRHRETPMLPAASLSAFASAALALPFAHSVPADGREAAYLVLFGVTQFGLGLLLLTLGSRLVSPTRAALVGNVEIPLGPALVWLAFGEVPGAATMLGGGIVMAAVVVDLAWRQRAG